MLKRRLCKNSDAQLVRCVRQFRQHFCGAEEELIRHRHFTGAALIAVTQKKLLSPLYSSVAPPSIHPSANIDYQRRRQ